MKFVRYIYYLLAALIIFLVLFYSRQVFFYKYEPEYQENLYYHSQWNYPNSTREISDSDIYQFVGYRLVKGENPFNINYEIPPFGKYLYGLAEVWFGNPYIVTTILYIGSYILLFLIFKTLSITEELWSKLFLLFATTPFVATQIRSTMLDLPLMFFYLLHILFFLKFLKKPDFTNMIVSGIFLGIASGVKPPVYTPLILLFEVMFIVSIKSEDGFYSVILQKICNHKITKNIFKKSLFHTKYIHKFINSFAYSASVVGGYVLSYFQYFIRHPNPIPWIRLHEKPIKFYLGSPGAPNLLNVWKGIFLNVYEGWWGGGQQRLDNWSLILPVGVVSAMYVAYLYKKEKDKRWLYLSLVVLSFLTINTFIPFFPRYLVPIIPLLVILIGRAFRKAQYFLVILSIINIPFLADSIIPRPPERKAESVVRFLTTRAYRELYRSMPHSWRQDVDEEDFLNANEKFFNDLKVGYVFAESGELYKRGEDYFFPVKIKYVTEYGNLIREAELKFIKVNGQWMLDWNWDYIWPGYKGSSEIDVSEGTIPLRSIILRNDKKIAVRSDWYTVYVIPRVMFDWNKHLVSLSNLTGLHITEIDRRVRSVVPDHYSRFVGYLSLEYYGRDLSSIDVPGVTLQDTVYLVPAFGVDKSLANQKISDVLASNPELFNIEAEAYIVNGEERILLPFKGIEKTDIDFVVD